MLRVARSSIYFGAFYTNQDKYFRDHETTSARIRNSRHQRQARPTAKRPFFFYKTQRHDLDQAACAVIVDALQQYVATDDLDVGEIQVISPRHLADRTKADAVLPAVKLLADSLGFPHDKVDIVYCEWAPVHSDLPFQDTVFVAAVLSTGPSAYLTQVFRTTRLPPSSGQHGLDVQVEARLLNQGDVFVLDPTMPHMAAPAFPSGKSFLVLLQWEQPCAGQKGKRDILRRFPRLEHDQHQSSMLDL